MTGTQTVTVLFTDIVGSTELSARLGPAATDRVRQSHFSLLRQALAGNDGTEVKNLGDGLMAVFGSASAAVACAVAMQQAVEQDNRRSTEPIGLRVAMSCGEATVEDGDYFGDPVVEASRLCALCEGGQVLVTETVKVFDALRPLRPEDVVRGQYDGYLSEPGVSPDSRTETFVALRCFVDNSRWAGVPFYLRTGKRLAEGQRMVAIGFRELSDQLFAPPEGFPARELVFDLGDPGSISTHFLVKAPGPTPQLAPAPFAFHYEDSFTVANQLEAYERLIHDALIGDHTLFTRADGIERLWQVSAPVLEDPPPLHTYEPGSWGPQAVHELIAPARWYLQSSAPTPGALRAGRYAVPHLREPTT